MDWYYIAMLVLFATGGYALAELERRTKPLTLDERQELDAFRVDAARRSDAVERY